MTACWYQILSLCVFIQFQRCTFSHCTSFHTLQRYFYVVGGQKCFCVFSEQANARSHRQMSEDERADKDNVRANWIASVQGRRALRSMGTAFSFTQCPLLDQRLNVNGLSVSGVESLDLPSSSHCRLLPKRCHTNLRASVLHNLIRLCIHAEFIKWTL